MSRIVRAAGPAGARATPSISARPQPGNVTAGAEAGLPGAGVTSGIAADPRPQTMHRITARALTNDSVTRGRLSQPGAASVLRQLTLEELVLAAEDRRNGVVGEDVHDRLGEEAGDAEDGEIVGAVP